MKILLLIIATVVVAFTAVSQRAQDQPFSLSGKVVDKSGKPIADARVQVFLANYRWAGIRNPVAKTDDSGNFALAIPRVGTYTIIADKVVAGFPSTYQLFYNPEKGLRPLIIVSEESPTPVVTVLLPEHHAAISGAIVKAGTNKPVTSALIKLCRMEAPQYCFTHLNRSVDGKFLLAAIDGPFSVDITADGYNDWFMSFPKGLTAGAVRQLEVALGENASIPAAKFDRLPAPEIVFPLNDAELYGFPRITRIQWSPVPGAASYSIDIELCEGLRKEKGCFGSVPLQMPTYEPTAGIKDTHYEFEFIGQQPGRYRVWAVDSDGRPGKKTKWLVFYYR